MAVACDVASPWALVLENGGAMVAAPLSTENPTWALLIGVTAPAGEICSALAVMVVGSPTGAAVTGGQVMNCAGRVSANGPSGELWASPMASAGSSVAPVSPQAALLTFHSAAEANT